MSRPEHRWLAPLTFLLAFVVLYFSAMPLFDDPDVPWHLATGQLILTTHHLPATDPWSFASQGAPWYNLSWWWDVKIAVIEQISGLFGVFIFAALIGAALLAFMAWRLVRLGIALPAILLTMFLAVLCMVSFTTARPHIAGYGFILLFQALLHTSRKDSRYGKLLFLPLLMALWANVHGSFLVGYTLLAAYATDAYVTEKSVWLRRLMLIAAACAICTLANPYGIHIYTGTFASLASVARSYINEWQPLEWGTDIGLGAWILVFILASNIRTSKATLADKLLAFFWFFCAWTARRNGAIFMLVSAPYLAACLDEQTKDLRKPTRIPAFLKRQTARHSWIASIAAAMVFITIVSVLPHDGRLQSPEHSAKDAIDFALQRQPNRHYLNDYDLGGQIIYYAHDQLAFFIDSRADTAYSQKVMGDYLSFLLLRPDWQEIMATYGINSIIVSNQSEFAKAYAHGQYHEDWKLIFAGKTASVYNSAP